MNDDAPVKNATYIATKADIARLEEQLKGLDRATDLRFLSIEALQNERSAALRDVFAAVRTAVDKAELAQHNVNMAQNEFRAALSDQAKTFITRSEHDGLDKRIQNLERGASGGAGRSGGLEAFKSNLFAILALLIALASLFLRLKN